ANAVSISFSAPPLTTITSSPSGSAAARTADIGLRRDAVVLIHEDRNLFDRGNDFVQQLQSLESLINIVISNEYLQMLSNRAAAPRCEMPYVTRRGQRTLRLSADSLPRLLTISYSTV